MRRLSIWCLGFIMAAGGAGLGWSWADWPSWRGPRQEGVASDVDLVSKWSPAGENLAWRAALVGRSTPVVIGGRVCANGRTGSGSTRQETGARLDGPDRRPLSGAR